MPNWTPDQRNCIDARRGTVLVSAAAGSGKTAVLIERVIQRLLDQTQPCSVSELLIVTFTKAAAAEMRQKLENALTKALKEDPDNEHLQKQQMLLPSAQICTIDSFCSNLVREHFDTIGITPDFRLLDENEGKLLQQDAVATIVENLYDEGDPTFTKLVELLFAGRDDASLEEAILKLYNYSRAYPSPEAWLKTGVRSYDTGLDLTSTPIFAALQNNISLLLSYALEQALMGISALQGNVDTVDCTAANILENELNLTERLQDLIDAGNIDEALSTLTDFTWDRWSNGGKNLKDLEEMAIAKACRDELKSCLKDQLPKLLVSTLEDYRADCDELYPLACTLVDAVLDFGKEYDRLKLEANVMDFSDVELYALRLLVEDPSSTTITRTTLAKDLGEAYKEILIDEYQDTNKLQDTLFSALSKEESNLFMVGDVKQSIYRFRQAMPEIFLGRKNRYQLYDPSQDNYPATIILGKNFRSREGITQSVNFTFRQLMSRQVGEIIYDQAEELVYGADYPAVDEPDTDFFLLEKTEDLTSKEREARFVTHYIERKLKESAGTERPLQFKDFVILLQAPRNSAATYEKALNEAGIPVYAGSTGGFLHTPDIQTVLSLLRVIDNPLQDIPLISCLMSPLFGFTEDDIAAIRVAGKYMSFYAAVLKAEAENEKCAYFLAQLRRYRQLSVSLPSGELLRQILEDTAFLSIAAGKRGGLQREANLRQLLILADDYDSHSTYGLAGFLRSLDRMEDHGMDPEAASTLSEDDNVVRIMSIHKSKGLQFKYCILADLSHSFNNTEITDSLLLHPSLGIGLKGRDFSTGFTYPTLVHTAMKEETRRSSQSEALRVLYVAMTRAAEKLVLVGSIENAEKYVERLSKYLHEEKPIHPYVVKTRTSFLDLLTLSYLRHPALKPLASLAPQRLPVLAADFNLNFTLLSKDTDISAPLAPETEDVSANADLVQNLKERLSYEYPYAALATTVTKRAASTADEGLFHPDYFAKAQPEFMSKLGFTPAERGTCLHKYMQYADFLNAARNPKDELDRLVAEDFFTEGEAAVIPTEKVKRFFESSLAARIFASPTLYREKKFAVLEDAGTFDPTLPEPLSSEKVLIQGIVDCAFEENGHLVVVDYKTDRVLDPAQLTDRYRSQILTYCRALTSCTGTPVKEAYLYSFALDTEVPVPLDEE